MTLTRTWWDDPQRPGAPGSMPLGHGTTWTRAESEAWARGWNDAVAALLPDPLAPTPGLSNTHSPGTSHEAGHARTHVIKWANDRGKLMRLLRRWGPNTAAALADMLEPMSRNQCASRLGELRKMGMVEYVRGDDGSLVSAPTGPNARGLMQRLTAEGRRVVDVLDTDRKPVSIRVDT